MTAVAEYNLSDNTGVEGWSGALHTFMDLIRIFPSKTFQVIKPHLVYKPQLCNPPTALRSLQVFPHLSSVECCWKPSEPFRMLSWVVKVVPQPPELPSKNTEDPKEGKPDAAPPPAATAPPPAHEKKVTFEDESKKDAAKPKQDAEAAAGNGPAPGMLTWISNALPQPTLPANQNRVNSTAKQEEGAAASKPDDEKKMMDWISQGLEKVVPQPDLKSKDLMATEQQLQVQQTAAPAELQNTGKEPDPTDQTAPPSMMEWIKHGIVKVVPQPETLPKTDGTNKSETQPPPKAPPAAPPPATRPASETDMMGWIISGIGRMLPQPIPKLDAGNDEAQITSTAQKKTDLVLEDLEEVKEEPHVQHSQQLSTKETDDAETQVDQLTPLMDSIKKEAGEAVLAHMEERLQQERLEAARVAEEMARKAAEEAVRQLEVEHSAKIVIETLPESNEQLPNILEEENEDEPELQNLQEDSDDSTDNKSKSTEEKQADE
ncbi:hypothetical protein ATANTOWER_023914 [Ataeniobius toweri]|uniref:Uncharacterized protein n=1 Tax=Ataeniobius toweri TaxID=208326 RepID=A0ABU7C3I1_9TELE|nr:hypothetical protein [Ataeniobius toweri]